MHMSEAEELFNQAYEAQVVDERSGDAIALCRRVLELDPSHYRARVFLGMLLDDFGDVDQRAESRDHFVEAIRRSTNLNALCDSGYEESAIHHLALWELDRGLRENAALLFLTDALLCKSRPSYEHLLGLLDDPMKSIAEKIRMLVESNNRSAQQIAEPDRDDLDSHDSD
jgi:Flp pilus assembly protein TadD